MKKEKNKKEEGETVNWIIDEIGQFDFKLHKNKNKEQGWNNLPIFTNKERYIKLKAYCRGKEGLRDYGVTMEGLCRHKECNQCRSFEKLYQEEVTRQLNKLKDENNNTESN